jgi:hypothetical protein
MKYLKTYENNIDYNPGDYITLKTSYGNYYNKFYEIIEPAGWHKYKIKPLFTEDKNRINPLFLLDSEFNKCSDKELKEINTKLAEDKYNF